MRQRDLTFATDADLVTFEAPAAPHVFKVDAEKRTITGLAVPYGVQTGDGRPYVFSKGSIDYGSDPSRIKLLVGHDWDRAIGRATTFDDTDAGLIATFKIARGAAGDEALGMAEDGVWDGLSIGLGLGMEVDYDDESGVANVISARLREISQTPCPAYDGARITQVAASATNPGGKMKCTKCGVLHAEGVTACKAEDVAAFEAANAEGGEQFTAITDAIKEGFEKLTEVVVPGRRPPAGQPVGGGLSVSEPSPYRFDGTQGEHDFSHDLIAAMGIGPDKSFDADAHQRVMAFMGEALGPRFVDTGDTGAVNPSGYRADMFVGYQKLTTPLRNAFFKGTLTDVTPFSFSKFSSASELVDDHVEGVEPDAGDFTTATGATITPAPVSGKLHITREVADQGGNPQVSQLLWDRIQYDYLQAMEVKAASLLSAAAPAELGANIAAGAATVDTLAVPVEQAIAKLNFVAGGNRFDYWAAHLDLYLALSGLKDADKRPYFPIVNPQNANGQQVAGYKSIDVAGTQVDPVWSLGTTSDGTAHKSYVIDTSVVWFWHSAPTRLDRLQEDVEGYDLGVWGYWAGVISDASGIKKITYDPVA